MKKLMVQFIKGALRCFLFGAQTKKNHLKCLKWFLSFAAIYSELFAQFFLCSVLGLIENYPTAPASFLALIQPMKTKKYKLCWINYGTDFCSLSICRWIGINGQHYVIWLCAMVVNSTQNQYHMFVCQWKRIGFLCSDERHCVLL